MEPSIFILKINGNVRHICWWNIVSLDFTERTYCCKSIKWEYIEQWNNSNWLYVGSHRYNLETYCNTVIFNQKLIVLQFPELNEDMVNQKLMFLLENPESEKN